VNGESKCHRRGGESISMGCLTPGRGKTPLIKGNREHASTPRGAGVFTVVEPRRFRLV
jgi:hypothetical protein